MTHKLSVLISFLTYSSFILDSWAEPYPGNKIPPNIYGYNQVDQYKTIKAGNFYVYKVTFTTINELKGNGGAIYVDSETNLLVESSSFIKCHSKGFGGAIYFNNTNGRCFLKKVCSTNSYSSKISGHFCIISTKPSDKCTNCIEHSSVANLKSTTNYNVHLIYSGSITLKYDNITKNRCYTYSALSCVPSNSSSVSYTSFENNTATEWNVICFGNNQAHDMNLCNVIGNTNNNKGIIYVNGSLKVSNSCLIENTKTMFDFFGSSSTCTIINCTIDSTDKFGSDGSVTVDSNSRPSKSFINNLNNNGCFSMNDSDDTKDSNSKCICMTFNMIGERCNMLKRRDNYFFLIK